MNKIKIEELKRSNSSDLVKILNSDTEIKLLKFTLENLGKLPSNFNGELFLPLCKHNNEKIRLLAIKNLGKLSDPQYLSFLSNISKDDCSTIVRREAISSIGRMRTKSAIPFLLKKLKDTDPKIVLQVIRALLVFKENNEIINELKKLKNHPNEIIQDLIHKEFFSEKKVVLEKNHADVTEKLKNVVVHGDVTEILKFVDEESIHLTFTSPPYYNARDYSIYQSYSDYLKFLENVFKEVYRITKEGRFFILNTSPVIIPRISRQHSSKRYSIPFDIHPLILSMGWEFIDDIIWVKPEASVKDRNSSFRQHRKPLAYKPNARTEYLMVYRKKTTKLIDWNIKQYDKNTVNDSKVLGKIDKTNIWEIDPVFDKTHSAVFPKDLCERVIRYYSFKGDLVYDPFGGSGTFGEVALLNNRHFFLTEINKKYFERISQRLSFSKNCKYFNYEEFQKWILQEK